MATTTRTMPKPGAGKTLTGTAPYPSPRGSSPSDSTAPSTLRAPSIEDFKKQGPLFEVDAQRPSTRTGTNAVYSAAPYRGIARVEQAATGSGERAETFFGKVYLRADELEARAAAASKAVVGRSAVACCLPEESTGMRGHGVAAAASQ